jgi:hypothetical protein
MQESESEIYACVRIHQSTRKPSFMQKFNVPLLLASPQPQHYSRNMLHYTWSLKQGMKKVKKAAYSQLPISFEKRKCCFSGSLFADFDR